MIILLTRMQVFLINRVLRVVPSPPPPLSLLKRQLYSTQRRIQDFFQEGVHLSLIYFNTNKPHSSFFFAEYQLYQKTAGQGGGCTPPAPSPQIRPGTVRVGSHVVIARRSRMWTNQFMVYCCISGMFHFQVLGLSQLHPGKNSWSFASITPVFS